MRKTKIVCTLGPSTDQPGILRQLLENGMNVARFNFSHGDYAEHKGRLDQLRALSKELDVSIPAMLDTKGPEIRLGEFENGKEQLTAGQKFILTSRNVKGTKEISSITYKDLPHDVSVGGRIMLDDGLISLRIESITDTDIVCTVENDGVIKTKKGVNVPGVHLSMPYMSQRDRDDILFGIKEGYDFIAASFTRTAADVKEIRDILEKNGGHDIKIIAKIENQQGVDNIDSIIEAADGIMIARGDMGVEIPLEDVPVIQKDIIAKVYSAGKQVITATQMLDSMIRNPRPTRAEVTDVANAIYDGTDAVMLSGETAAGRYPLEAVRMMTKIAESSEPYLDYRTYNRRDVKRSDHVISNALSSATVRTAEILNAKAIIVPTMHGFTANLLSNWRPKCRIIGMSPNWDVLRKMQLNWGVTPVKAMRETDTDELIEHSVNTVKEMGYIESGDTVIVTVGVKHKNQPSYAIGETNNMRVIVVN